jgi:hypothetical protein
MILKCILGSSIEEGGMDLPSKGQDKEGDREHNVMKATMI